MLNSAEIEYDDGSAHLPAHPTLRWILHVFLSFSLSLPTCFSVNIIAKNIIVHENYYGNVIDITLPLWLKARQQSALEYIMDAGFVPFSSSSSSSTIINSGIEWTKMIFCEAQ